MNIISRVAYKIRQSASFLRHSNTPLPLILDSFKLKRGKYVAVSEGGLKFEISSRDGECFTFYENIIRRDYLRNGIQLAPGDNVIDIGANTGLFAILAAQIVGPSGKVFAFEPARGTYARLKRNIELNGFNNITAINAAIGAATGEAELHLADRSSLASLYKEVDGSARTRQGFEPAETVRVETLASVMSRFCLDEVKLLKLDCEGAEYDIFGTLEPTVAGKIKQISMEVHQIPEHQTTEIPQMLKALGFTTSNTSPLVAFLEMAPQI